MEWLYTLNNYTFPWTLLSTLAWMHLTSSYSCMYVCTIHFCKHACTSFVLLYCMYSMNITLHTYNVVHLYSCMHTCISLVVLYVCTINSCIYNVVHLGPSYTIPDCLCIGLLFVSDRGFIYTTTQ